MHTKKRKPKVIKNNIAQEIENMQDFNNAKTLQEKLVFFSKIQSDEGKMELLKQIPENERYKFIGKLKQTENIATALGDLGDDETRNKTFQFVAKQYKGNGKQLLELSSKIDFPATIPSNLLTLTLNNLNGLNLDLLLGAKENIKNFNKMKFKLNEIDDSRNIEYSFAEFSIIMEKIEELTADIPDDMSEADKFFTIYSRLASRLVYDHRCVYKSKELDKLYSFPCKEYKRRLNSIRRNSAGVFGPLVFGKGICAGDALALHLALQYVGMKSQYVGGYPEEGDGHAWTQVQIDGEWYNTDITWDATTFQFKGIFENMLLCDEVFDISHGEYCHGRPKTYRKCKSKFDYSKISCLDPKKVRTNQILRLLEF